MLAVFVSVVPLCLLYLGLTVWILLGDLSTVDRPDDDDEDEDEDEGMMNVSKRSTFSSSGDK
jgi:hypothetical protein